MGKTEHDIKAPFKFPHLVGLTPAGIPSLALAPDMGLAVKFCTVQNTAISLTSDRKAFEGPGEKAQKRFPIACIIKEHSQPQIFPLATASQGPPLSGREACP
ncbi:hypothetical protein MKZ38_003349 [Zalerion maritima]|uniref:Uncharacterized protein n=1 Tax=Zalerion maritima TaxID=339359 RepID=A0AAD5RN23_9PEZI|nr:hypothetical protein MKZ38_003349 [Zalerion maritima]